MFEHFAATALHTARTAGVGWKGRDDFDPDRLAYELRPSGNRPRREGLWVEFDAAVNAVAIVMAGRAGHRVHDRRPPGRFSCSQHDEARSDRGPDWRVDASNGQLPAMVDTSGFQVEANLAVTEGLVVLHTEGSHMGLICNRKSYCAIADALVAPELGAM